MPSDGPILPSLHDASLTVFGESSRVVVFQHAVLGPSQDTGLSVGQLLGRQLIYGPLNSPGPWAIRFLSVQLESPPQVKR